MNLELLQALCGILVAVVAVLLINAWVDEVAWKKHLREKRLREFLQGG